MGRVKRLEGKAGGIPHLAKNERDVGHPVLVKGIEATELVQEGGFFPVEVAAQDGFDDEMIGGGGGAYTYSNVDFPLGRHVQIRYREDLLLLIV